MENDIISVIVPVYNVEKFLNKCIETIVQQSYKRLEIILIDDGSTDNSGKICDLWKEKDKRIVVYHKENEGLGYARNSGLKLATGKYVVFIDSDDFIDLNMIYKLYYNLNDADTVLCNYNVYYSENKIEPKMMHYNRSFQGEEIKEKFIPELMGAMPRDKNDIILPVSVWHGLYSLDIIKNNKIFFPSERIFISEDMIFDIDYYSKANKINVIEECLYYYRKNNEKSLTSQYNALRFDKEIILYKELYSKLGKIIPKDLFDFRLKRTFLGRVRSCIKRSVDYKENMINEIKKICDNSEVQSVLKTYPYYKNPIKLRIFNFAIKYKIIFLIIIMIKIKY